FPVEASKFKEVFGEDVQAPSHATQIGINSYEWGDNRAKKEGTLWTFQKKIDGAWYQYMDQADLARLAHTKLVLPNVPNYKYWRSLRGLQNVAVKIYDSNNELSYEAKVDFAQITNFKRISDSALLVNAKPDSAYHVFGQIESWDKVYIWQNPTTQEIIEVELPRLNLVFKNTGSKTLCADHTGYQVAEKQYIPELGVPVNYLVCEKDGSSQKLILMPPNKLEPTKLAGKLKETLAPEFETIFDSSHVLLYEQSPLSGLSATTEESRYYLALRKLFQRQYREAAEIIRNTSIELKPLEPNEQKIVSWLIEGNEIDSDPRSYAVRLLASYWNSKHEQYYQGIFRFLSPKYHKLYAEYLKKVNRVDPNILGIFEEKQIATMLGETSRLEQLKQEAENRPFNPSELVSPKGYGQQVLRADYSYNLEQYKKLFDAIFKQPTIGQQPALKPKEIIIENTFPLLYKIVAGEPFNKNQALNLLELVIGIRGTDLTDKQIREEFSTLIHLSVLDGSEQARFLEAIAKSAKEGREVLSIEQTRVQFQNLARAKRDEEAAYQQFSQAHKRSARWEDYRYESDRWSEARQRYQNLETNFNGYFADIKISDQEPHRQVEVDTSGPGEPQAPKTKEPIIPKAPEDIKLAELPLKQIIQEDPLKNPLFDEAKLKQALDIQALDASAKQKIVVQTESLQSTLGRSQTTAVQELNKKIGTYAQEIQQSKRFYSNVKWQTFKAPTITTDRESLKRLNDDILALGQRYAPTFEGGALNRVLHLADVGRQINLNDLIYVLVKRNLVALHQTQGALNLEDLNLLYEKLIRYLMLSTYVDHVNRFEKRLNTAHDVCSRNEQSDECQIELETAVKLAAERRHYSIESNLEYLIFEYFMKLLVRPEQVQALNSLQFKDGQITNSKPLGGLLELIMGAGKTSVILPLLSMLNTSKNQLNIVVLPEALITSMSVQLSKQLSSSFSRGAMVLHVSRQRYLYEQDLALFYDRLSRAREQNQTVITTNSSIQSLFLSFIDRLSRYHSDRSAVEGEINQFYKIFRLLR
ncbi:MAG: DUF3638 domain-containing protein, partial [Deltaproteobacteria bacterium]|nr:DUF3638 domain-containing protein [Deltaproteobacteria bacterium]